MVTAGGSSGGSWGDGGGDGNGDETEMVVFEASSLVGCCTSAFGIVCGGSGTTV